jgi:hypothetical protein
MVRASIFNALGQSGGDFGQAVLVQFLKQGANPRFTLHQKKNSVIETDSERALVGLSFAVHPTKNTIQALRELSHNRNEVGRQALLTLGSIASHDKANQHHLNPNPNPEYITLGSTNPSPPRPCTRSSIVTSWQG